MAISARAMKARDDSVVMISFERQDHTTKMGYFFSKYIYGHLEICPYSNHNISSCSTVLTRIIRTPRIDVVHEVQLLNRRFHLFVTPPVKMEAYDWRKRPEIRY